MSLYQVTAGQQINAQDLNQVVQILQQPSGGSDVGESFLGGWSSASGQTISVSVQSRSRGSTPSGVTPGTTSNVANINTPLVVSHMDSNGFQLWSTSSTGASNCFAQMTWTINY